MFDTKIVFVIREDLAVWQKLNVTAFLATGIATESPEIMGQPYRDASGRQYGNLLVNRYWSSQLIQKD